ncbi:MAG: hypothetical protein AB1609_04720, partial [Bacillota bacterium]
QEVTVANRTGGPWTPSLDRAGVSVTLPEVLAPGQPTTVRTRFELLAAVCDVERTVPESLVRHGRHEPVSAISARGSGIHG